MLLFTASMGLCLNKVISMRFLYLTSFLKNIDTHTVDILYIFIFCSF